MIEVILEHEFWENSIEERLANVKTCCNSIFSLIFIDLGGNGCVTPQSIKEYILKWNKKQSDRGLSVVQLPLMIGIEQA